MSIYRVTIQAEYDGTEDQFNVHHYQFPSYVPSGVELEEFVDNLAAEYDSRVLGFTTGVVEFKAIEVRRVDVGNLPSAILIPATWPAFGTNASGSLPPQICAMLRFTSPSAFPRTGRVYLQTFGKDQCTDFGRILAARVTSLDALALALEEIEITGQVDAQKVAVKYGGSPRVVIDQNVLFQTATRNIFQTQRRRTVGVGS